MSVEAVFCTACWALSPASGEPLRSSTSMVPPPRWTELVAFVRVTGLKVSDTFEGVWDRVGRPRMLGTKKPRLKSPSSLVKLPKGGGSGGPSAATLERPG